MTATGASTPGIPALTDAEHDLVDHYLALIDRVAAVCPASGPRPTYSLLLGAQALVSEAVRLRTAAELMFERGEREIHASTLAQALQALDGERRCQRVRLPATPAAPHGNIEPP
ncbi:hypothetical protein CC117_02910 [Parafrankia colletiae]|uniref:Uncharacterized protein n=1 Tax=Parafrankia colletiae TaxID=573497 RepID=A0A1S1QYZ9_9ACTN|nr:hypothetical protein [Parafrankia colletiae]MCK9899149.1 hypothetical protein [Frankia sp. Cpl3]OHV38701.1 hypothetical protein CC117_02910 [Parafrankia colletiae]